MKRARKKRRQKEQKQWNEGKGRKKNKGKGRKKNKGKRRKKNKGKGRKENKGELVKGKERKGKTKSSEGRKVSWIRLKGKGLTDRELKERTRRNEKEVKERKG